MFILSLPIGTSIALAVTVSASLSVALYFVIHRFWSVELTDETKKTADIVATRIIVAGNNSFYLKLARFGRLTMIDKASEDTCAGSAAASIPKAFWIAVLAVLLGVPLEADVEDGMKEQQKSKNYAVRRSW
jgi:hypothetical protein